jgi:hypothetical protein
MKHKRLLLHSTFLLLISGQIWADAPAETGSAARASIFLGIQDYYWDERDDPGSLTGGSGQLLEENGYLFELGVGYDNYRLPQSGLIYSVSTGITGGTVEYDGQTQAGDPASTDVDYLSWDIEGEIGYRFSPGDALLLDLIGGIGYDYWSRELKPTTISSGPNAGTPVSGVTEHFNLLYTRLTGGLFIPGKSWDNRLRIGARLPLFIEETVDQLPGLTLKPKMQLSPFVEWQLEYKGGNRQSRPGLGLYYEETRFDRSDAVLYGTQYYWQPESFRREAGLRVYYHF